MAKKVLLFSLLFTVIILFSFNAISQYVYKKPAVKKINKEVYYKKLLDKQKKDKQNRSRPFVYMYI